MGTTGSPRSTSACACAYKRAGATSTRLAAAQAPALDTMALHRVGVPGGVGINRRMIVQRNATAPVMTTIDAKAIARATTARTCGTVVLTAGQCGAFTTNAIVP